MPHAHSVVLKLLDLMFSNQPIEMQHDSTPKHKPLTLVNFTQIIVSLPDQMTLRRFDLRHSL